METKRLKIYRPSVFFEVESGAGVSRPHIRAAGCRAARLGTADHFIIIIPLPTLLIWGYGYNFLHQFILIHIIFTEAIARCHCILAAIVLARAGGEADWLYLVAVLDPSCQAHHRHVRRIIV